MAAPIELNSSTYIVTALTQQIGKASTLTFYKPIELGDDTALANRTEVKFTVSGVVWFHGRTLPARRVVKADQEMLEYTAADYFEFMGKNPLAWVNERYNVNQIDGSIYAYPYNKSLRQIIETELAPVIGGGNYIASLDWSDVPTATQNLFIYDFEAKGKTILGLLESLANEVPSLGYWLDVSAVTTSGSPLTTTGAVLRFYDLSVVPASPKVAKLPARVGTSSGVNCEAVDLQVDIGASYDTLQLFGWGDMREYHEQASPQWETHTDQFGQVLSYNPIPYINPGTHLPDPLFGRVDRFVAGSSPAGGQWTPVDTYLATLRPWYPDSPANGARFVCRRFSVTQKIVDLKLHKDDNFSPPRYTRVDPSITCYIPQWKWDTGPIGFVIGGTYYNGQIIQGRKKTAFTNGVVDDLGTVTVTNADVRIPIGSPESYEKNYLYLAEALVRTCYYEWTGTTPAAAAQWSHIADRITFTYFPTADPLYVWYTGMVDLSVTVTDGTLGYGKKLQIWDQRFFKYTDFSGTVLRDDTATLTAYATMMFALLKRPRVYGTVTVTADPASVNTNWPMGAGLQLKNWQAGDYTVPARVQGRQLTRTRDSWNVELNFDNPQSFASLDKTLTFRQWFNDNQVFGGANPQGRRGQMYFTSGKNNNKTKKPESGPKSSAPLGNGIDGFASPVPPNPPVEQGKPPVGQIKAVSGTTPGPASGITYTVHVPYRDAPNKMEFTGVIPGNRRQADADISIHAATAGTPVTVCWEGDVPVFLIPEQDHFGPDCV